MTNFTAVLKNMIPFSKFNRGQAGKIFDEVKNNKPECVLVSVNDYIKMVDEINDNRALLMAADRMSDFSGNIKDTFSQEEVEQLLGIDISNYEEVEIKWHKKFNITSVLKDLYKLDRDKQEKVIEANKRKQQIEKWGKIYVR